MWVRRWCMYWGDELVITPQLQRWMFPGRESLQHAPPPPPYLISFSLVMHSYDCGCSSQQPGARTSLCRDCLHFQCRDNPISPNRLTIPLHGPQIQLSHLKTLVVTNGTAVEVLAASLWNFALPLLLSLWDKQSGAGECAGTQGNAYLTRTPMFVHCRSPFTLSPTEPAAFAILCLFTSITLPVLSFYTLFNSTLNSLLFSRSLSLQRIRAIRSGNYILAIISLILPA